MKKKSLERTITKDELKTLKSYILNGIYKDGDDAHLLFRKFSIVSYFGKDFKKQFSSGSFSATPRTESTIRELNAFLVHKTSSKFEIDPFLEEKGKDYILHANRLFDYQRGLSLFSVDAWINLLSILFAFIHQSSKYSFSLSLYPHIQYDKKILQERFNIPWCNHFLDVSQKDSIFSQLMSFRYHYKKEELEFGWNALQDAGLLLEVPVVTKEILKAYFWKELMQEENTAQDFAEFICKLKTMEVFGCSISHELYMEDFSKIISHAKSLFGTISYFQLKPRMGGSILNTFKKMSDRKPKNISDALWYQRILTVSLGWQEFTKIASNPKTIPIWRKDEFASRIIKKCNLGLGKFEREIYRPIFHCALPSIKTEDLEETFLIMFKAGCFPKETVFDATK